MTATSATEDENGGNARLTSRTHADRFQANTGRVSALDDVAAGLTAGMSLGALAGCHAGRSRMTSLSDLAQAANSGNLIVGLIPYYEMLTDHGADRAPTGFMADLFGMFAHRAGFELNRIQWRTISWASFGAMVRSGGIDFSIAGTFVTPERSAAAAFTRPLFRLGNGAVARRVPRAVEHGSADVGMSDQFILSRYVNDPQHTRIEDVLRGRPFSVLPIAWAIAHQPQEAPLLAEINTHLDAIVASDEFVALKGKYPTIPFAPAS